MVRQGTTQALDSAPGLRAFLKGVGRRLRDARKEKNLTQEQLADILGTNKHWVFHVEDGSQNWTVAAFWKMCDGLGVHPSAMLLEGDQARNLREVSTSADVSLGHLLDSLNLTRSAIEEARKRMAAINDEAVRGTKEGPAERP